MSEGRTSVFSNGLIWFGAGMSIAEILTGTYPAPLGFGKNVVAILLGHMIGCVPPFLAGLIGGYTRRSSMETVKMDFGERGSLLFCALNVPQLVGWTPIMTYDGALAVGGIFLTGKWIWCLVIGGLILVWILIGIQNLERINTLAMGALLILALTLCHVIFTSYGAAEAVSGEAVSFGATVELSVAMPLSQFPLISDYTREAERPFAATAAGAAVYGVVSISMYVIGIGAIIYTGKYDISIIMVKADLGLTGLPIVILSTVTTTFLDAYSAGISNVSVSQKIKGKWAAVTVTVIGTAAAMVFPMDNITDFLCLISSVFAPMIAIRVMDYSFIKQGHKRESSCISSLVIWFAGLVIYRVLIHVDTPMGSTLPGMAATMGPCLVYYRVTMGHKASTQGVIEV